MYFNKVSCIAKKKEERQIIKILISKFEKIYGSIGIHPHESKKNPSINSDKIIKLRNDNKKILGIGETGLDFYYNHSDKVIQKKLFLEHIHAASILDLPVIIHSRNAEKETLEIIKSESKNTNLKTLLHCFTGSKSFAHALLDLGSYISISGIVTFKNSSDLVHTISSIPIERLLIETDSPYLSPVPLRGKSNEPSHLIHTANKLALIKNLGIEEIEKQTTKNFFDLFKIK